MERRSMLRTAMAAVVTGAGVTSAASRRTAAQTTTRQEGGAVPAAGGGGFVRTRDGEQLFVRDCGTGAPVVFVAAWALPGAMWDYQMTALVEQGFRAVAYDR